MQHIISLSRNPYDFCHPVSERGLFAGRTEEIEEIRYYLDHAKESLRPINIALLGSRASGKTSVLNMAEIEAKERGFCTVKISLDENDAKTQLGFFFKIFNSIFSAACDLGAFGGKEGKTFYTYQDIVHSYQLPQDENKLFCPFIFPLQYATAMRSRNYDASLSDYDYQSDLNKIKQELKQPIVLLMDEGDVLSKNRVHLEKLRNIFDNVNGYMIILTGTNALFPAIDDVFSPMTRQFKKIFITNFKSQQETEECIKKPLERIGIEPDEIFDFKSYSEVKEIHNLANGRPYEVQLICHMLFKRVQTGKANRMKIDIGVLDDVRKEIESSQDLSARPLLSKIRNLRLNQLEALNLLCIFDGCANFEQIWDILHAFNLEGSWQKDRLKAELQILTNEGILEENEGIIRFPGDDFDKIYIKYFLRKHNINWLNMPADSLRNHIISHLHSLLVKNKESKLIDGDKSENIIAEILREDYDKDILYEGTTTMEALYCLMMAYRRNTKVPIIQIRLTLAGINIHLWYYSEKPNDFMQIENSANKLALQVNRINAVGGTLEVAKKDIQMIPTEIYIKHVIHTANSRFRNKLANYHAKKMVDKYTVDKDKDEATFNADLSYKYNPNPMTIDGNNLGYLFMVKGDLITAEKLLNNAARYLKESFEVALVYYNLGILAAKKTKFPEALTYFEKCVQNLKNINKQKRKCACLITPKLIGGKLDFIEIDNPDLLETANDTKTIIEGLLTAR